MTDTQMTAAAPKLSHFPVTLFATVMGLAGLAMALHKLELVYGLSHTASNIALVLTIADFLLIGALFLVKCLRHPAAIRAEWNHPVKMAFFPAISISLILIATALMPVSPELSRIIWPLGAASQAVLTISVISGWIGRRPFQAVHISPAWFIPAVGNVIAPVAGIALGFTELSWLFFATGMIFWIVLLTLVMNRLIFHDPLPARLLPTLVILIAPPAVAFLAWVQLNGGVLDALARILFYAAILFAAIVAVQARGFAKLPFSLSWWALSFPVASLTLASMRYGEMSGVPVIQMMSMVFMALLLIIIFSLVARTLLGFVRDEICIPD